MYLNGWVAIFQLVFSLVLCVPSIYAQPTYGIADLLPNMRDGFKCLFGVNSIMHDIVDAAGKVLVPKDDCALGYFYPNAYMFFNIIYNIFIVNLLKFGGANLFYVGATMYGIVCRLFNRHFSLDTRLFFSLYSATSRSMVPIVNTAFSLDFMPKHQDFTIYSVFGLVVILLGLLVYRFAGLLADRCCPRPSELVIHE